MIPSRYVDWGCSLAKKLKKNKAMKFKFEEKLCNSCGKSMSLLKDKDKPRDPDAIYYCPVCADKKRDKDGSK